MIFIDILVWAVLLVPYVLILFLGIKLEKLSYELRKYKNMVDIYYKCASRHFEQTYERIETIERNME